MNTNSLNSLDTKDAAVFVLEDDTSKEHLFKQHLKVLGGNAERKYGWVKMQSHFNTAREDTLKDLVKQQIIALVTEPTAWIKVYTP